MEYSNYLSKLKKNEFELLIETQTYAKLTSCSGPGSNGYE